MSAIFDALPGLEVPVGAIGQSLVRMWADTAAAGRAAPEAEDAKATQVNVVLHLGLRTTPADGLAQFQTAVAFSKRYPSRVVVLCPERDDSPATEMRAKVYGECHLGKSKSDKRCVEFVMLSYPRSTRRFLENQVSICLSTDLPLYYWVHGFSENVKLADYNYLLTKAKRVLLDSAIAPADALTYPWPRPETLRDLVHARLLPIRQGLGQFLSRYPTAALADDLELVTLAHDAAHAAEARVLLAWVKERIGQCGENRAKFTVEPLPAGDGGTFALKFEYAGGKKSFAWTGDLAKASAVFSADFGGGRTTLPAAVSLLSPEAALTEAMFF